MLKITNNNTFDLVDRYDGQDYLFPAGKTVRCPMPVAVHIFGVGNPNKAPYLIRQGWVRNSGDLAVGMKKLNKFSFEMIEEKHEEEFALIEQRKAPLHQAGAGEEAGADDSSEFQAPAPKSSPRSILKRLEQAPA